MCGITGILHFDRSTPVDSQVLHSMACTLAHRGPDDSGEYIDRNAGLGFRRLSIIDLSRAAHQPMPNEDESVWIVFNGEIYNFSLLRSMLQGKGHIFRSNTDSEVVVHAYEEFGTSCLEHLDGMFAFAIWDKRARRLFLARDRFGIKPLYYTENKDFFAFGSEMKALLEIPKIDKEIDYSALWNYLSFMQIPAPQSIYKSIRKLLPGHAMVIPEQGQTKVWQYWDLKFEPDYSKSEKEWREELSHLLQEAVRTHLVADVPVGVFLSGGFDSSCIAALAARVKKEPIKTFSVSFVDDQEFDEAPFQRIVARHIGSEHYEFKAKPDIMDAITVLLKECDEPFAVSSAIPLYYVSKLASQHVKVVLSGDGSDELFAGYEWRYRRAQQLRMLGVLPKQMWRFNRRATEALLPPWLTSEAPFRWWMKLCSLGSENADARYLSIFSVFTDDEKRALLHPDIVEMIDLDHVNGFESVWRSAPPRELDRKLYFDAKTSLPDEMLTKVDRCTSAVSIEGRVPFLDKKFAEAAARVPAKFKLRNNVGKSILKSSFSDLIPREVVTRKKAGFSVPIDRWINNMSPEDFEPNTIIPLRRQVVHEMLRKHKDGRRDFGAKLWAIRVLSLWSRISCATM